jgi:hypothetical protein
LKPGLLKLRNLVIGAEPAKRKCPQRIEQLDDRDCGSQRAFSGGGFEAKRVCYSIEKMLVSPAAPHNYGRAGSAGRNKRCEICFRHETWNGNI